MEIPGDIYFILEFNYICYSIYFSEFCCVKSWKVADI